MKRLYVLLLALAMLLSMAACGKKVDPQPAGTDGEKQPDKTVQPTAPVESTPNNKQEDWGVHGEIAVQAPDKSVQLVCFRWPVVSGQGAATGFAGAQDDGTVVLVDRHVPGISPENVSLTEFLPAYSNQVTSAFEDFYFGHYEDGAISVDSYKVNTVNGYEVCKFNGHHSYNYDGETYNDQYVAYVTTTKGNGGYVYWLVQDVTSKQTNSKLIEEHASNIIQSVWETE